VYVDPVLGPEGLLAKEARVLVWQARAPAIQDKFEAIPADFGAPYLRSKQRTDQCLQKLPSQTAHPGR
jgi:hypothetical protein